MYERFISSSMLTGTLFAAMSVMEAVQRFTGSTIQGFAVRPALQRKTSEPSQPLNR
jgi:hypothetical protein